MSCLELEERESILTITLNRPEKANALSLELIHELIGVFEESDRRDDLRIILLKAAGDCFSAGGDIDEMEDKRGMFEGTSSEIMENYRRGIQRIPIIIERLRIPLVAAIDGPAVGAGLDLALMCDIRIASVRGRFGETFCKIGLISGDGGAFFLTRVVGYAKALEMTLTGKIYNADEALEMGLVTEVTSSENLEKKAFELCRRIAQNAPLAVRMAKQALKQKGSLEQTLDLAAAHQAINHQTQDHKAALEAFRKKSKPHFQGF